MVYIKLKKCQISNSNSKQNGNQQNSTENRNKDSTHISIIILSCSCLGKLVMSVKNTFETFRTLHFLFAYLNPQAEVL